MKKIITLVLLIFSAGYSFAQGPKPSTWTYTTDYSSSGEVTLVFKLKLDNGWHVYSQKTPDGGPLPMVYKFEPNDCYELDGPCMEPKPHEEFDSTFEIKVLIFDGEVTFRQKVKVKNQDCKIQGTIEYQVCKDACIFKETGFTFNLKKMNVK